jgi:phosphatidylglycerol:prolipoprotein diacylglycerol transferase
MNKTTISFPGLGIEEITLNKIAISLFNGTITIRWYAIFICLGILLAYFYFLYRGKKNEAIDEDNLINIVLFVVPIAIIGARFLFVLTSDIHYNSFLEMIAIWNGGLAIYGAIIFGFLTIVVYSKVKRLNLFKILDAICPAVLIGQILGRWGNFFNGEAFGSSANVESLPWRMVVNGVPAHPTFLYESLWNLIGFIIANILYKNKKFNGQIFTFYISWYGFGRAFIEMLRTDSLYVGKIKLMVILGFGCFIVGTILYIYLLKKEKHSINDIAEYEEYKKKQNLL